MQTHTHTHTHTSTNTHTHTHLTPNHLKLEKNQPVYRLHPYKGHSERCPIESVNVLVKVPTHKGTLDLNFIQSVFLYKAAA